MEKLGPKRFMLSQLCAKILLEEIARDQVKRSSGTEPPPHGAADGSITADYVDVTPTPDKVGLKISEIDS